MKEVRVRNHGIDLLRIVSMFMICVLHILGQGGVLDATESGTMQHRISWILEALTFGAVNCYGLISGYVGVNAEVKYRSIIRLWLQVFCYCVGITLFFKVCGIPVGRKELLKAALPVINEQYWYFTGYFCLFFFTPFLNRMIKSAGEKGQLQMMFMLLLMFSFLQAIGGQIFYVNNGYSVWWLMILYLLGGCIHEISLLKKTPWWIWLCIYLVGAVLVQSGDRSLMTYFSPAILLGSIALLALFSRFRFGNRGCKLISKIAPLTFGVYLIHTHPLIFNNIIWNSFRFLGTLSPALLVLGVLACAAGIFIVCIGIDSVRNAVFKWIHINWLCEKMEKLILWIGEKVSGRLFVKA